MLVTQVRCLVFLPGSRNWIYSNVRARWGCKIFLVELPGSRICRSILLMVFKALHKSGVTADLEEKAWFRMTMVLRTSWQHNGLWQAGNGRRFHPIVGTALSGVVLASCGPGSASSVSAHAEYL